MALISICERGPVHASEKLRNEEQSLALTAREPETLFPPPAPSVSSWIQIIFTPCVLLPRLTQTSSHYQQNSAAQHERKPSYYIEKCARSARFRQVVFDRGIGDY